MDNLLEIVAVFSPIATVTISAVISVFVARASAKNEIKKLALANEREDSTQFKELFSTLMEQTEAYCSFSCDANKLDAIKTCTKLITYAPKQLAPTLKEIDTALSKGDICQIKKLRTKLLELVSP